MPQNQLILYMIRIFLTGYMGAGKTTLGKAFAKAKGIDFIDLDWYIEKRFHKTVRELFAERGEDGFRLIERNMLREVGEFENVLISTGGGTPCFFDNMEYMNQQGETVFLDVPIDVLFRRLKVAKHQRPILKDKNDDEDAQPDPGNSPVPGRSVMAGISPCKNAPPVLSSKPVTKGGDEA